MENKKIELTTSKTWFIVLFLIVFCPVGIFFMWKHNKWNIGTRIIVSIIAVIFTLTAVLTYEPAAVDTNVSDTKKTEEEEKVAEEEPVEEEPIEEKPAKEETPTATLGEQNALSKAYDYLDYSAFSRKGLIEQLEYEGYSNAEAVYAVDNCKADWNAQAALKAKDYMNYSSFSRQGLIDQLIYEGYTRSQAEYGVKAVGY